MMFNRSKNCCLLATTQNQSESAKTEKGSGGWFWHLIESNGIKLTSCRCPARLKSFDREILSGGICRESACHEQARSPANSVDTVAIGSHVCSIKLHRAAGLSTSTIIK